MRALLLATCTVAPGHAGAGNADGGIAAPLDGLVGDPDRGRALVAARDPANCVLCHAVPADVSPIAGDVGPPLAGVGRRLTPAQIRLRIIDSSQVNPDTVMPPYHRVDGLHAVASEYRGKTILTAQQVEDIVAWLATLR